MIESELLNLLNILKIVNRLLSSAIIVTGFSLTIYILTHNLRSSVARAFGVLMSFVTLVYLGDFALFGVDPLEAALPWLKMQWVGIAFVPAAYLQLSNALLVTTNDHSRLRRGVVLSSYVVGVGLVGLVIFTGLLVGDVAVYQPGVPRLQAGPLFWIFTVYFFLTVGGGAMNIQRARERCLTPTSRRRMTYLAMAFVAPALGVFPYVMLASLSPSLLPAEAILAFLLMGNVGVLLMTVVMAYTVSYFGVLTPDRVVKQRLAEFLLRGPLAATVVIILLLTVPKVEATLGLPRDTVLFTTVVASLVLLQVGITIAQPLIDRLIYRQDRNEIAWLRHLDTRLLTATDMRQFLENLLSAVCDTMRVTTAFVAAVEEGQLRREAFYGNAEEVNAFLQACDLHDATPPPSPDGLPNHLNGLFNGAPLVEEGFWVFPLRTASGEVTLGVLGVEARRDLSSLSDDEAGALAILVSQAEGALADRHLQQSLFGALEQIIPEIEAIQRRRGTVRYAGSPAVQPLDESLIYAPEFPQLVKDALQDYWGGPRLSSSPLLRLAVVKQALDEHNGQPIQTLRAVLLRAVEALRPNGERKMTTKEWLLYNILDLKFLRGERVSYVASRLAMSESDLYRKQRVAIKEVAKTLARMEEATRDQVELDLKLASTARFLEKKTGSEGAEAQRAEKAS
jgi:hypothetical protein